MAKIQEQEQTEIKLKALKSFDEKLEVEKVYTLSEIKEIYHDESTIISLINASIISDDSNYFKLKD